MRFASSCRVVALAAGLAAQSGCAASSPYDRAWVTKEIDARTGHLVGDPTRPPSLPPGLASLEDLTEDQAVSVALWNSVAFENELAQLGFARADLADAGALPNPALGFLFPVGPRQLEFSVVYPIGALLQRKYHVAAAKLDVERTARALVQTGLDRVRDTRLAFTELVLAEQRERTRDALRDLWVRLAKIAQARVVAGEDAAVASATAESDALTALEQAKRAHAEVEIARAKLRMLLGLADSPLGDRISGHVATPDTRPPLDESKLLKMALAARPDVRAAELAIDAAGERLGWERAKVFQFAARLDGKPIGTRGGPPVLLLPGFQAEIPLFNWNEGGKDRAKTEIARAGFHYLITKQVLATEIRVGRTALVRAIDALGPFRDQVAPVLEKASTAALRSYEEGNDAYLLALDAARRLEDARLRLHELEADVFRARAELNRAVGGSIDAP